METVKIRKETFDKIANFKSKNPECKNFDDALGLLISDLENEVKVQKEESVRFQNGLHDKNRELEKLTKEKNALIEAGTNGTEEQALAINNLNDTVAKQQTTIAELQVQNKNLEEQLQKQVGENYTLQEQLQKHVGENDSLHEQLQQLKNADGMESTAYQLQIDKLNETINSLQAKLLEYENTDKTNKIQLLPPVQQIMDLVAEKLSKKYNATVYVADIINKMVLRYNVERWTEWFYPFCISDAEIKQITGKTTEELKQFFNGK